MDDREYGQAVAAAEKALAILDEVTGNVYEAIKGVALAMTPIVLQMAETMEEVRLVWEGIDDYD